MRDYLLDFGAKFALCAVLVAAVGVANVWAGGQWLTRHVRRIWRLWRA